MPIPENREIRSTMPGVAVVGDIGGIVDVTDAAYVADDCYARHGVAVSV